MLVSVGMESHPGHKAPYQYQGALRISQYGPRSSHLSEDSELILATATAFDALGWKFEPVEGSFEDLGGRSYRNP